MNRDMTKWCGWTLVDRKGHIVVDTFKEPFLWSDRNDAKDCADEYQKVVRCELRVVKAKP